MIKIRRYAFPDLSHSGKTLFPADTLRQGVDGIFDTLKTTVFLLVAIQVFQTSDHWNSLISMALDGGMLAALLLLPLFLPKYRF